MIRTIALYLLVAVVCAAACYIGVDYIRFKQEHKKTHTQILVIAPGTIEGTVKQSLINQIRMYTASKPDVSLDAVSLKELNLPFISSLISPLEQEIDIPVVISWADRVTQADAIIALVPDTNDGYPAELKNAIDLLWKPLHNKQVGSIIYSTHGLPSDALVASVQKLFRAVKSDPLDTVIRIDRSSSAQLIDALDDEGLEQQIATMVDDLVDRNLHRSYFKQLFRAIGDKLKRRLLRLINPKV